MYEQIRLLVGMPRSGTSWLSQIVESCPEVRYRLSPLFAYAFKNAVDEHSTKEEYERVFQGAYLLDDEFMTQAKNRKEGHFPVFTERAAEPRFLAIKMTRFHHLLSHILELFDNVQVVAIVRHPCGAINSWLKTPKEFPATADPLKEWRYAPCRKNAPEEFWGFEDWKAVTRLHLRLAKEYPQRFMIQQYEFLVRDAMQETKKMFRFLGLPYTSQTESFLIASQTSHDTYTHAVFKNPQVAESWNWELDERIKREIIQEVENDPELKRFLV